MKTATMLQIADAILDLAEYWRKQHFSYEKPVDIASGMMGLPLPETSSLYRQTGPLGYDDGFDELPLVRLRKVVFRLVSREDSPCSLERYGTYLSFGDNLWFDVSIYHEDESWTGGERQEPIHALVAAAPDQLIQEEHRGLPLFYVGDDRETFPPWLCRTGSGCMADSR
jgi:hypothetical protein